MKINKKDPGHLALLGASVLTSILACLARPFVKRKTGDKIIIFYGHTLNGNLKAFYDYLLKKDDFRPYFLALDSRYYKRAKTETAQPDTILNALNPIDMLVVARADAIITSHGLHMFVVLRWLSNIKFIDVWHAVSFKGWGKKGFSFLRDYDAVWTSSKYMHDLYITRYRLNAAIVKETGYARTDQLVDGSLNKRTIIKKYKIPNAKQYILIAPTWQQDQRGRPLLPFGIVPKKFFGDLDKIAQKNSTHIIFRAHLNSGDAINLPNFKHISFMPYNKYPVVEDFLFIADILISDWSSVSIDYLPLRRPTLFLDVPAPYKHPFNIDPEHRFGDIVQSFSDLKQLLNDYLQYPQLFVERHTLDMNRTTEIAYSNTLDGKSTARYYKALKELI